MAGTGHTRRQVIRPRFHHTNSNNVTGRKLTAVFANIASWKSANDNTP